MLRSLLQSGIQRYKSVPRCVTIPGFNNDQQMRPITMAPSMTQKDSLFITNELREMMALWPSVVKDVTEYRLFLDIPDVASWVKKLLEYTVPNSQKLRTMAFIYAYHMLARPEQITDEKLRLLRILAWGYEMNQAYALLIDDILDRAKTRRGQPCWHLQNNLGTAAVNDGCLLEQASYQLLNKHFRGEKCYLDILEDFLEISQVVALVQTREFLTTKREDKLNFNLFTMDRCNSIFKYKAGHYVFYTPVKIVLHFLGIPYSERLEPVMKLLMDMGMFYQVQDDYLDCYGDLSVDEEISTDIQEGKCTWLIVQALQRVSPFQRRLLEECYGYNDPEKVARVKQLYDDLELPKIYANYEEEYYKLTEIRIQQISCDFPHELLLKFLWMNYGRNK